MYHHKNPKQFKWIRINFAIGLLITIRCYLWTYVGIGIGNLIISSFHHRWMVKSFYQSSYVQRIWLKLNKYIFIYKLLKVKTKSQAKRQVTNLVVNLNRFQRFWRSSMNFFFIIQELQIGIHVFFWFYMKIDRKSNKLPSRAYRIILGVSICVLLTIHCYIILHCPLAFFSAIEWWVEYPRVVWSVRLDNYRFVFHRMWPVSRQSVSPFSHWGLGRGSHFLRTKVLRLFYVRLYFESFELFRDFRQPHIPIH